MNEASPEEIRAYQLAQQLNIAAAQFDELCEARHRAGQEEYGELTFLENDVIRMMLEELADVSNYCRMHAVKLLILQSRFEAEVVPLLENQNGEAVLGWKAFKGTKPAGWSE